MALRLAGALFVGVLALAPYANALITLHQDRSPDEIDYNLRFREIYLDLGLVFNADWDSNYQQAESPDGDTWIVSSALTSQMFWQPVRFLTLDTSFAIRYEKFFGETDNAEDGFRITGGDGDAAAIFGFDVLLDERVIRFEAGYRSNIESVRLRDPNQAEAENRENFTRQTTSLSAQYAQRWTPHTRFDAGYRYTRTTGRDERINTLDQTQHLFNTGVATELNDSLVGSITLRPEFVRQDDDEAIDYDRFIIETALAYTVTGGAVASLTVGADTVRPKERTANGGEPVSGGWSPRAALNLSFALRNLSTHSVFLEYSRRTANVVNLGGGGGRPGGTGLETALTLGHRVAHPLTPELSIFLGNEWSRISDEGGDGSYSEYNFNLGSGYQLGPKWSIEARYNYSRQFSGSAGVPDFSRQRIGISVIYDL